MTLPFDTVIGAFLAKISEFEFIKMSYDDRDALVDDYLKRAVTSFRKNCKYDLQLRDDELREFTDEFEEEDVDELVDIISEGMVVQWLKQYVYQQENLENNLSTRDFSVYSPAELLYRVGNAYSKAQKDYTQMIREYSYNHADLTRLHI